MQRVGRRHAGAIGRAFDLIPADIHPLLGADFFCADPVFAALHSALVAGDGRSLAATAHCCYPWHVRDRRVTICVPIPVEPQVIVHELGHVLDYRLGFAHPATALTRYAQTNRREAFAEAFTAWVLPDYLPWGRDGLFADRGTVALFDSLTPR